MMEFRTIRRPRPTRGRTSLAPFVPLLPPAWLPVLVAVACIGLWAAPASAQMPFAASDLPPGPGPVVSRDGQASDTPDRDSRLDSGRLGTPGGPTFPGELREPEEDGKKGPQVFVVPFASNDPNRGFQWGAIVPILQFHADETATIWAPGISVNDTVGVIFAGRFLYYGPRDLHIRTELVQATGEFSDFTARLDAPRITRYFGVEAHVGWRNDQFQRFFGLGPEARTDTSYVVTGPFVDTTAWFRATPQIRFGVWQQFDLPAVGRSVTESDQTVDVFPDVPGVGDTPTVYWHGLRFRFDSRDDATFPTSGFVAELDWSVASRELGASFDATRWHAGVSGLVPVVKDRLQIGARGSFTSVSGPRDIPFRALATLGGFSTFRGGPEGRFFDRRALSGSLEIRWRAFKPTIFGFKLEVEFAPFVDVGQVFDDGAELAFKRLRWASGLGVRFMIRPRVMAAVDLGVSRDGAVLFTRLSYPF